MAQRPPTALQQIQPSAIVNDGLFSDARIELIRNSVAKGAPDDVFLAMIDIAKRRNLDPLANQISCAKIGGSWVQMTRIDGYRSIAEQTGRYAGSDAPSFTWYEHPVYTEGNKGGKIIPESATITVYKLIDGERYPFSATVYWEEFSTNQNNWVSMPRVMLAKVAESHALRKAFPAVLSGLYTDEEMDQAAIETQARVVDRETGEIQQQRTSQPVPAQGDDNAAWKRECDRLHAIAGKHGITHIDLHTWAVAKDFGSVKQMSTQDLMWLASSIEQGPEDAKRYFAKLRAQKPSESIEVAGAATDPAPQWDDSKPLDTSDATMDEVEAALAASTPVLPGMDDVDESVDADRFTH